MTTIKQPVATEHQEQCAVIDWAELMSNRYPELKLLFAIPNGGNRHVVTAVRLKAEGVKSGVPDLFLPCPQMVKIGGTSVQLQGMNGLWIEMKKRKGSTTSKVQKWWHEKLREQGYRVEVCKGAEAAIEVLSDYLGIKGNQ